MRLEPELWDALNEICERESEDISNLMRHVEAARVAGGRTSAVRVFIVNYFRKAASESGHAVVGRGPNLQCGVAETLVARNGREAHAGV